MTDNFEIPAPKDLEVLDKQMRELVKKMQLEQSVEDKTVHPKDDVLNHKDKRND